MSECCECDCVSASLSGLLPEPIESIFAITFLILDALLDESKELHALRAWILAFYCTGGAAISSGAGQRQTGATLSN